MNRWIHLFAGGCIAATALHGFAATAQDRIYRCGNEYTNNAALAKQGHCQPIEGGHVTVVHTQPARPAPPAGNASSTPRPAKIAPSQQQARDSDARAILQSELDQARQKLQALQTEYNDGNPIKTALELRNPQIYQERLQALTASLERQQADVTSIERELARHRSQP